MKQKVDLVRRVKCNELKRTEKREYERAIRHTRSEKLLVCGGDEKT